MFINTTVCCGGCHCGRYCPCCGRRFYDWWYWPRPVVPAAPTMPCNPWPVRPTVTWSDNVNGAIGQARGVLAG